MIQHVWEAASKATRLGELIVATDSPEIVSVVEGFGGRAVLTGTFESGTDRVAYVARQSGRGESIIVNLQGDEPLLDPKSVDRLIEELETRPELGMATLGVKRPGDHRDLADSNVVKIALSTANEALYFSRQPLRLDVNGTWCKHIGIYAFRRDVLLDFCGWKPSNLERAERLEQLRALDNGVRIRVVLVERDTIAVDTPDDVEKVERAMKEDTITA